MPAYLLIGIIPGLAVLLYQIIFRRGRQRRQAGYRSQIEISHRSGQDSELYELEQRLAERGLARGVSEPLYKWLARVVATLGLTQLRAPLLKIFRLHYRYRFDPKGLDDPEREALRREAKARLENLV